MRLVNVSSDALARAMEQVEEARKSLFDAQEAGLRSSLPDAGDLHCEAAIDYMERAIRALKED